MGGVLSLTTIGMLGVCIEYCVLRWTLCSMLGVCSEHCVLCSCSFIHHWSFSFITCMYFLFTHAQGGILLDSSKHRARGTHHVLVVRVCVCVWRIGSMCVCVEGTLLKQCIRGQPRHCVYHHSPCFCTTHVPQFPHVPPPFPFLFPQGLWIPADSHG